MAAYEPHESSLLGWTHAIYALHAFSILTGILGVASVIGSFLVGWPSLLAVVLNYVKRSQVRGTWLESHFRWQIRTFWFGLLWVSLCGAVVLVTLFLATPFVLVALAILTVWFIYRIARGWSALASNQPMYQG
jgi:uncharacterized membrane protein